MHSYISRGLAISIHPFHHNCLHLSLLRAHEGPVGLDETGETGGCFQVCQPVPELPICAHRRAHTQARAHTVCWVGGCFAVLFFFFNQNEWQRHIFPPSSSSSSQLLYLQG